MDTQLQQAVADLARIDQDGQLDELRADIGDATRGWPANDLDRCTGNERFAIERLATLAQNVIGMDSAACLQAATAAVIPTRQQAALDCIDAMVRFMDGTTAAPAVGNVNHGLQPPPVPDAIRRARGKAHA